MGERMEDQQKIPEWIAKEIRDTWRKARSVNGQCAAFNILERMVSRLGYGQMEENNPSLASEGPSYTDCRAPRYESKNGEE